MQIIAFLHANNKELENIRYYTFTKIIIHLRIFLNVT